MASSSWADLDEMSDDEFAQWEATQRVPAPVENTEIVSEIKGAEERFRIEFDIHRRRVFEENGYIIIPASPPNAILYEPLQLNDGHRQHTPIPLAKWEFLPSGYRDYRGRPYSRPGPSHLVSVAYAEPPTTHVIATSQYSGNCAANTDSSVDLPTLDAAADSGYCSEEEATPPVVSIWLPVAADHACAESTVVAEVDVRTPVASILLPVTAGVILVAEEAAQEPVASILLPAEDSIHLGGRKVSSFRDYFFGRLVKMVDTVRWVVDAALGWLR
ncbi:hypothetical protein MMC13_003273 [Lambiella insularis]|nr:hypothetical protein [Lambiella insularis]